MGVALNETAHRRPAVRFCPGVVVSACTLTHLRQEYFLKRTYTLTYSRSKVTCLPVHSWAQKQGRRVNFLPIGPSSLTSSRLREMAVWLAVRAAEVWYEKGFSPAPTLPSVLLVSVTRVSCGKGVVREWIEKKYTNFRQSRFSEGLATFSSSGRNDEKIPSILQFLFQTEREKPVGRVWFSFI